MAKKVFKVEEHTSGYSLTHVASGKNHWLSDGVDAVFGKNEKALSPGTESFRLKWEREFNSDVSQTLEAYFPELGE